MNVGWHAMPMDMEIYVSHLQYNPNTLEQAGQLVMSTMGLGLLPCYPRARENFSPYPS